tara:strand:+ start:1840 stop:2211 length:372 start_codon:yes stop_codon:yes gene_type:complete
MRFSEFREQRTDEYGAATGAKKVGQLAQKDVKQVGQMAQGSQTGINKMGKMVAGQPGNPGASAKAGGVQTPPDQMGVDPNDTSPEAMKVKQTQKKQLQAQLKQVQAQSKTQINDLKKQIASLN